LAQRPRPYREVRPRDQKYIPAVRNIVCGGRTMNPDKQKPDESEPPTARPACACSLGARRSWTVVFLGIILVILAVALELSPEAVLIIGLIPLAVLVASAVSGRGRRP
jgi:hypothetical protein